MSRAYYVLIFGWPRSSRSPILLVRTRQRATGVPTSTVGDSHRHSHVFSELAVVAIANFLSEFGQLCPKRPTRLPRGGIAAVVQPEPKAVNQRPGWLHSYSQAPPNRRRRLPRQEQPPRGCRCSTAPIEIVVAVRRQRRGIPRLGKRLAKSPQFHGERVFGTHRSPRRRGQLSWQARYLRSASRSTVSVEIARPMPPPGWGTPRLGMRLDKWA